MMIDRRCLGVVLAGAALAGCATDAQTTSGPQALSGSSPSALRLTALSGGAFLMQSAQLGASKAQRPELRRFAPFEVSEQQGLVQAMGLVGSATTPPAPTSEKAAILQQLQTASGSEFDRLFVAAQIQGHREALAVYTAIQQSSAAPASDRAIALLAADRIREHLTLLEALTLRA
jgi:putative membrane protein